jgi:hypothetical protein
MLPAGGVQTHLATSDSRGGGRRRLEWRSAHVKRTMRARTTTGSGAAGAHLHARIRVLDPRRSPRSRSTAVRETVIGTGTGRRRTAGTTNRRGGIRSAPARDTTTVGSPSRVHRNGRSASAWATPIEETTATRGGDGMTGGRATIAIDLAAGASPVIVTVMMGTGTGRATDIVTRGPQPHGIGKTISAQGTTAAM